MENPAETEVETIIAITDGDLGAARPGTAEKPLGQPRDAIYKEFPVRCSVTGQPDTASEYVNTDKPNILDKQQYPRLRPLSCNRMDASAA